MSGHVRARRPASPPPGVVHPPPPPSQRFPHPRGDHLDADARRAAASMGLPPGRTKHFPPGGLNVTPGEWKLLFLIVLVAAGVRLFRLSDPHSVVCVVALFFLRLLLSERTALTRSISANLHPSISRRNTLSTSILRWPNFSLHWPALFLGMMVNSILKRLESESIYAS